MGGRDPYSDRNILYLDYGGGYINLHMWQNCIKLNTYTHTQMSTCKIVNLNKVQWIVSMSILDYDIVLQYLKDVMSGKWEKGTRDLCFTSHNGMWTYNYLKIKFNETKSYRISTITTLS